MLSFYRTVQIAYEHRIAKWLTTQFDAGYVIPNSSDDRYFSNKRGVKLKSELRYYYDGIPSRMTAYYVALEGYYNLINFDRRKNQAECFDAACVNTFQRTYNYKVKYREPGFSLKIGYIKRFSKRVLMDLNTGLSCRFVHYFQPTLPPAAFQDEGNDVWPNFPVPNEQTRTGISPVAGIRFGFAIK